MDLDNLKVAVLDDYIGLAKIPFSRLESKLSVAIFPVTLLPYNHPDTPEKVKNDIVRAFEKFHIICTMRERTPFPKELVDRLPKLKLLLTTGLRNNSLDLQAFADRDIPVIGTKGEPPSKATNVGSTVEHTVAFIMALARGLVRDTAGIKEGRWQTEPAIGLSGKTLGLVGLGKLGAAVAKIMHLSFGMKVIAWSQNLTQDAADEKAARAGFPIEDEDGEKTYKAVSREELFSTADIVSMHLVLSSRTRNLINKNDLSRMKSTALFVNTARGPLVVQDDLYDTLLHGRIRGAAIDVFEIEPLPQDSRWRTTEWDVNQGTSDVILTPHMGYVEEEILTYWYEQQVDNIERWIKGESLDSQLIMNRT